MRLSTLLLSSLLSLTTSAAPSGSSKVPEFFDQRVVFTPPSNYTDPRTLYARTAQFKNGNLLATWENYSPEGSDPKSKVYFPIYKSTDGGYNWKEISRVYDQAQPQNGLRYQPFIYVLPEKFGKWPAGTVLLSGSSIPTDLSTTQIELYASTDKGYTWEFISHIAAGGVAIPNNGLTPVWEPFLMLHEKKLICYYSDQRDNATYGQKMVHQTTTDGINWGPVVNDIRHSRYTDRPGMPTVTLLPNGKYLMTYEYGGGPTNSSSYKFPLFYRLSSDPEKFDSAEDHQLITTDGTIPEGSPYNVWTPYGGKNGTIIVSSGTSGDVYINRGLGEAGTPWIRVPTGEKTHYTRHLRVLKDPKKLLIMGGGVLPPSTTNKVQLSVVDITKFPQA
ncbi:bnr asp-box repeat domain protein [Stagonosporopsis vannaccii]|nr:bnr asp-box repeat domain protein [Stagonosporopsis vannaccii]